MNDSRDKLGEAIREEKALKVCAKHPEDSLLRWTAMSGLLRGTRVPETHQWDVPK